MARLACALLLIGFPLAIPAQAPPSEFESAPVFSAGEAAPSDAKEPIKQDQALAGALARTVGMLAFVLGLILLVTWLARRYLPAARRGGQGPDAIALLSVRSLGARRSLLVVRVRGRCLLLGSTPNAITRLADLDYPAGTEGGESDSPDFAAELAQLESPKS